MARGVKADWHDGTKRLARWGGLVLVTVGGLLTLTAFADFFASFGDPASGMPTRFWMAFLGLPMLGIGSTMLKAGFLGEGARYVAGEVTPVAQDVMGELGFRAGRATVTCPHCRTGNDASARFCDACGGRLVASCAACEADHDVDARFCPSCGEATVPGRSHHSR